MDNSTGVIVFGLLVLFSAFLLVVWLYTLIDCLRSNFRRSGDKTSWLLAIILLPFLGSVLYLALSKKSKLYRLHHGHFQAR